MRCLLVRSGGIVVAVDLDQHDVGGVAAVLHHVETQHAGLGQRRLGVADGSGQKALHAVGHHPDVDVNHQHQLIVIADG